MALTQVQQGMLVDGILTADTAGRLKVADGFVNAAKLASGAARSNFGAGAVLQVVHAISTSQFTSAGSQTTCLEVSITAAATTNKLIVFYTSGFTDNLGAGQDGFMRFRRGGSAGTILPLYNGSQTQYFWNQYRTQWPTSAMVIDTSLSTSATTYGLYTQNSTGSCTVNGCSMILMEIAV